MAVIDCCLACLNCLDLIVKCDKSSSTTTSMDGRPPAWWEVCFVTICFLGGLATALLPSIGAVGVNDVHVMWVGIIFIAAAILLGLQIAMRGIPPD